MSIACVTNGETYMWGWLPRELRDDTQTTGAFQAPLKALEPLRVSWLSQRVVSHIACGRRHVCVVLENEPDAVYLYGDLTPSREAPDAYQCPHADDGTALPISSSTTQLNCHPTRLGLPSSVASVAVGDGFSLALLSDGSVHAHGDNSRGQLALSSPAYVHTWYPLAPCVFFFCLFN